MFLAYSGPMSWPPTNTSINKPISNGQATRRLRFYRYQEGAAIGGPIKRDKVFFFADYEDTQQQQFDGSRLIYCPHQRRKDRRLLGRWGLRSTIRRQPDNRTARGTPFPGNIITNPNPIALLYLSNMPKCNYPALHLRFSDH